MLKDIQCNQTGCGGMVQFVFDSNESVDEVGGEELFSHLTDSEVEEYEGCYMDECPECGAQVSVRTARLT